MRNKVAVQQRGKVALGCQVEWQAERAVELASLNALCILVIPGEPCTVQDTA